MYEQAATAASEGFVRMRFSTHKHQLDQSSRPDNQPENRCRLKKAFI